MRRWTTALMMPQATATAVHQSWAIRETTPKTTQKARKRLQNRFDGFPRLSRTPLSLTTVTPQSSWPRPVCGSRPYPWYEPMYGPGSAPAPSVRGAVTRRGPLGGGLGSRHGAQPEHRKHSAGVVVFWPAMRAGAQLSARVLAFCENCCRHPSALCLPCRSVGARPTNSAFRPNVLALPGSRHSPKRCQPRSRPTNSGPWSPVIRRRRVVWGSNLRSRLVRLPLPSAVFADHKSWAKRVIPVRECLPLRVPSDGRSWGWSGERAA